MHRFRGIALAFFALPVLSSCWGGADEVSATGGAAPVGEVVEAAGVEGGARPCDYFQPGQKQLYWGDLHVHTSVSLDAFAFGTIAGPAEAFAFAKGGEMDVLGKKVRLERPLDFVAVTDHAEWLDLMYICTNPENAADLYCQNLQAQKTSSAVGSKIFGEYVVPTITKERPQLTPICEENPARCSKAAGDQWALSQIAANEANQPCDFTALIGYEWSATPAFSHTHRNLIFASEHVTKEAIDYIRYPEVGQLWNQLERQCKPEEGCDVIAIPHNTNMGDGVSFDVETDAERDLQLRAKYERLVEIHQEKGNSECLPTFEGDFAGDCDFEVQLTDRSKPAQRADYDAEGWDKMRSTYVRGLLLRGLAAYGSRQDLPNPLQLGFVGSTDTHSATAGWVDEEAWQGSAFGFGEFETNMQRINYNPGGIVGVWAEQNTREAIFAALKRREVYGSSGPRIQVKFEASTTGAVLSCGASPSSGPDVTMGGEFKSAKNAPSFIVRARADKTPLESIEIIKGQYVGDDVEESVIRVWSREGDGSSACAVWTDEAYDAEAPAFWYARVIQEPTRRWSKVQCEGAGRCNEFPDADLMVRERAWASPIWHLPIIDASN